MGATITRGAATWQGEGGSIARSRWDKAGALAAIALMGLAAAESTTWPSVSAPEGDTASKPASEAAPATSAAQPVDELLIAGYLAQPYYYRSDLHIQRPDGTDARFKDMGWDGDALMPPIDGGVRTVKWHGSLGWMVDFLHNKAVARLGKGAHGRRIANPVIEDASVEGTWKGKPATSGVKLTDYFTRLEFTHGQNMLFLTPLLRLGSLRPGLTPYVGVGAGFALPHVELWVPGEALENRTNEYQYAGPALQFVAGLELRTGRASYFLEYKFSFAWIGAALTGEESWKNFNMPGDLLRQLRRWWAGEPPKYGTFSTALGAHQAVIGAGYWWQRARPAAAP
jgi:hypothetical protein